MGDVHCSCFGASQTFLHEKRKIYFDNLYLEIEDFSMSDSDLSLNFLVFGINSETNHASTSPVSLFTVRWGTYMLQIHWSYA